MAELITFSRNMFPPDSLGCAVFPEDLEGRQRQKSAITRPFSTIIRNQQINTALERIKPGALEGLLTLSRADLQSVSSKQLAYILGSLSLYMEKRVLAGPEESFLGWLFRVTPKAVPLRFEPEQKRVVVEALENLDIGLRSSLESRFGFGGETLSRPPERKPLLLSRIRENMKQASSKLWVNSPLISNLSLYAPFGEEDAGRRLWEKDFGCEVNELFETIDIAAIGVRDLKLNNGSLTGIHHNLSLSLLFRQPHSSLYAMVWGSIQAGMKLMDNGLLP